MPGKVSTRPGTNQALDREVKARQEGDVLASSLTQKVRSFIPRGATVNVGAGWQIIVMEEFQIHEDAELVLSADGILGVI